MYTLLLLASRLKIIFIFFIYNKVLQVLFLLLFPSQNVFQLDSLEYKRYKIIVHKSHSSS